jgi:hypothetical protein
MLQTSILLKLQTCSLRRVQLVLCLVPAALQVVREDGSLGLSKVFAMPHYQHSGATS